MKIKFKEVEDGIKNEIYVDDMRIGYVETNIWNQKWKIYPYFSFSPLEQAILYVEYPSFYKAGKALVKLYSSTFMLSEDEEDEEYEEDEESSYTISGGSVNFK